MSGEGTGGKEKREKARKKNKNKDKRGRKGREEIENLSATDNYCLPLLFDVINRHIFI